MFTSVQTKIRQCLHGLEILASCIAIAIEIPFFRVSLSILVCSIASLHLFSAPFAEVDAIIMIIQTRIHPSPFFYHLLCWLCHIMSVNNMCAFDH